MRGFEDIGTKGHFSAKKEGFWATDERESIGPSAKAERPTSTPSDAPP